MLKYVVLILHFNAESFWNETMYLFTWVLVMVTCFTSLSAIFQFYPSWQSVLLVKETGVPEENHRPDASH
jgi:hypothetical protein